MQSESGVIQIEGGCHCKAVRYKTWSPPRITVYKCNCSICHMKQNHHFMVKKSDVEIAPDGLEAMKTYTFNTCIAKLLFCGTCGVCPFYSPRSNPDCWAITIYCVDDWKKVFPQNNIEWIEFDGQNWESEYAQSDIKKHSSSLINKNDI